MKLTSFEAIVRTLNAGKVRYLVAGGLAVNAHGISRFTNDVDIVIRLTPKDILAAFRAVGKIGYKPVIPITAEEFSIPSNRKKWAREKNMTVLQMWSDKHPETPLDIFITEPFDFEDEYKIALVGKLSPKAQVRFVSLKTLIKLKSRAGRAVDKIDVENLKNLKLLKRSRE